MKNIILSFLAVLGSAILIGVSSYLPTGFAIPLVIVFIATGITSGVTCGFFISDYVDNL